MKIHAQFWSVLVLLGFGLGFSAQPPLSVPVVNDKCGTGPVMANGKPDTVATPLDSGFISLFNGVDLKGWWENCNAHSDDKVLGGLWIVDPSQKAIYSREEGKNGDILVTNQIFENYEFIMDLWPIYGNDGGIFNRVKTSNGSNWQTTIDYIQGSGVAGSYNEQSWTSGNLNDDPIKFGTAGPSAPEITTWTTFTKNLNPTTFGCSEGGCITSDFSKIWNLDGWNQIRVKFYGGLKAGTSVTMETFIRKAQTPEVPWVPVYKSTKAVVTPAGPIALQIHGNGRWNAGSYNMYRNIKLRRLDDSGEPLPFAPTSISSVTQKIKAPNLKRAGQHLVGELHGKYSVTLTDIRGHILERFQAVEGPLTHKIPAGFSGVLFVELKNNRGVSNFRLSQI